MSRGAVQLVREKQHPISLRCATFGATSMAQRHLATGETRCKRCFSIMTKKDAGVARVKCNRRKECQRNKNGPHVEVNQGGIAYEIN